MFVYVYVYIYIYLYIYIYIYATWPVRPSPQAPQPRSQFEYNMHTWRGYIQMHTSTKIYLPICVNIQIIINV